MGSTGASCMRSCMQVMHAWFSHTLKDMETEHVTSAVHSKVTVQGAWLYLNHLYCIEWEASSFAHSYSQPRQFYLPSSASLQPIIAIILMQLVCGLTVPLFCDCSVCESHTGKGVCCYRQGQTRQPTLDTVQHTWLTLGFPLSNAA